MSSGQPSTERDELIQQFCQITGASEERAVSMLDACDNDLHTAVTLEFDTQQEEMRNAPYAPSRSPTPPPVDPDAPQQPSPPVQPRPPFGGLPPFYYRQRYADFQLRASNPPAPRNVVPPAPMAPPNPAPPPPSSSSSASTSAYVTAPLAASSSPSVLGNGRVSPKNRPKTFDDLFRPPYDIMWTGPFVTAREKGTKDNRWLLVDLNNPLEFKCQMLNRDVWSDERIKTLVRENFVFWQTTPTTEEGGRFQSFYPVDTWPFFAIIDPRTGEKILWFSETDPNVVYASLVDFLGQRPNPEAAEDEGEVEKKQPSASVSAPGAAGKVNPDVVANALSAMTVGGKGKAESAAPVADVAEKDPVPTSDRWKQFLGPDVDPPSELLLRLPDGRKTVVSMPSSSKLKAVIVYAECLGFPASDFTLVTAFPRRNISELPSESSLKDAGLFPRETVIIKER